MIRKIASEDFQEIYNQYIRKDFPRNERRPLFQINKLFEKNIYSCWCIYEVDKLLAYACFIHHIEKPVVLLDYFAVTPRKRGKGIGSIFLKQLQNTLNCEGIIIECEMPSMAADDRDSKIRQKRIEFYERNGALLSDTAWKAFGVNYNLLWLPVCSSHKKIDIAGDIKMLYGQTLPAIFAKLFLSCYKIKNK